MNKLYLNYICKALSVAEWQVENCIDLFSEGSTIPFISRYRKERTGGLDEVQITEIKFYFNRFEELDKRKVAILKSIEEQEKLTPELKKEIEESLDPNRLEDIYLPYRPKRRTKASIAKERGLEPLAMEILEMNSSDCEISAKKYISQNVPSEEDALQGARDIIAEIISESKTIRESLRGQYSRYAKIVSVQQKGLDAENEESSKYRNYFDFSGNISNMPSHRVLALLRGANEGELNIKLEVDGDYSLNIIKRELFKNKTNISGSCRRQIEVASEDSYKRLLHPSLKMRCLSSPKREPIWSR